MHFATVLFAGAFAFLASAQTTTVVTTTAATATYNSAAASQSSAQAAMIACIDACAAGDVACQSKCIAVPDPSASQANSTVECVEACPKGNGTAADNQQYASCMNDCVGKYYFTTSGTPNPQTTGVSVSSGTVGTAASTVMTGTGSGSTGSATGTTSGSSSGTASAAASSSSSAAGEFLHVTGSAVGFFGLLAALLAI